jgi:hypothetical protein
MEKQTKILLGLAAAGVVAYLVFKPKKAVASSSENLATDHPNYTPPLGGDEVPFKEPLNIDKINQLLKSRVAPINGKCPDGYYKESIQCIMAPCPEGMCVPYPELT